MLWTVANVRMEELNKIFFAHSHKGGQFFNGEIFFRMLLHIRKQPVQFHNRYFGRLIIKWFLCAQLWEQLSHKCEKKGIKLHGDGCIVPMSMKKSVTEGIGSFRQFFCGINACGVALFENVRRTAYVKGEKSYQKIAAASVAERSIAVSGMKKENITLGGSEFFIVDFHGKRTFVYIPDSIIRFCLGFGPIGSVAAVMAELDMHKKV